MSRANPPPNPGSGGSGPSPTPLSPRNSRVADLARLARQRRAREAEGRFVLDGPVLFREALDAGIAVEAVYVDPETAHRPEMASVLAAATEAGIPAWSITGGLQGHVEVATPHGVASVARIPAPIPEDSPGGNPALHVVLVGVADPGNAGTILRTAEAVGATSVVLTEGSVDPWSPKVVRASAGSVLRVPIRRGPATEVLADLVAAGVRTVGTRAGDGVPPAAVDLAGPVALVLGSEAHGLPLELTGNIDVWTSLPMQGRVESLNVAVAGSVLAFEAVRQRSRSDAPPAATMEP